MKQKISRPNHWYQSREEILSMIRQIRIAEQTTGTNQSRELILLCDGINSLMAKHKMVRKFQARHRLMRRASEMYIPLVQKTLMARLMV